MKLTKSHFLTYLEAPLHLWLALQSDAVARPPSLFDQHIMKEGYRIESLAKEFLRQHVAVMYPAKSTVSFEVTLVDGNFESRVDALVHNAESGSYDLYEIKSSTSLHSNHKDDTTFQYLIASQHLPLENTFLVRVNNEYQRSTDINITALFAIEDMKEHIERRIADVAILRQEAWEVMQLPEKPHELHCYNPKTCSYPTHCFPNLPEYPIYDLGNGRKKQYQELLALGIERLEDIPSTFGLSAKQSQQLQSIQSSRPLIDREGIRHELNKLEFPLYFLDYETYGEAIPLFPGYKAHQQAVTQFSLHVANSPDAKTFDHYECLATEPGDPSRLLATELCKVIGEKGSIIVWNKSFECSRNAELAVLHPDLADQLLSINERTYDLMEIFSLGLYVDYRFHGSASIKKVLPVLCPELSYKDLEINEGTKAMTKWYEMVYGNVSNTEKHSIAQNLLAYCKLDTWAMVVIWQKLRDLV